MKKRTTIMLLTIAAFVLAQKGGEIIKLVNLIFELNLSSYAIRQTHRIVWYIAFPIVVIGLFHGMRQALTMAGLARGFRQGLQVGFVGTLPMLIGAGLLLNFNMVIDLKAVFSGCLLAALGEEILYRAMLFGQLFRHAKLGFIVAGLASAVIFGIGHLYQGNDPASLAGIFLVTFMGGMWFSWLYVEWNYNLWVPISFHFFMNLSWTIFPVSDTALGGIGPNVFRFATIALSIFLTLQHKRRSGEPMIITGKRWWSGTTPQTADNQHTTLEINKG